MFHPPNFCPDCACLRSDASTCLHHGQLQSMSFSVNTLTHGADLRHALRSNKNKGCPIPLHKVLLWHLCSARPGYVHSHTSSCNRNTWIRPQQTDPISSFGCQ
ncbi:putative methyltransferase C1B3.06c [Fusarium oxysporum f. sp. albedinis]|nr:putative methyltransferase C1B3.06c [Fusarium oxysporum f. sp. albedinis]